MIEEIAKPGDSPIEQPTVLEARHQSENCTGDWRHRSSIISRGRGQGESNEAAISAFDAVNSSSTGT
jgi:hypothetical protein